MEEGYQEYRFVEEGTYQRVIRVSARNEEEGKKLIKEGFAQEVDCQHKSESIERLEDA